MKKLLVILLIAFAVFSCKTEKPVEKTDGMFIHISHGSDDPHRALMGLSLASLVATDQPVLVFLDITGPELVLKESLPMEGVEFGKTDNLLSKLIENEAQIIVCPMCLKKMGKTKDDLIEGITIATKEDFFDFTDGRIITLDY